MEASETEMIIMKPDDRIVALLYLLMRDHLPTGNIVALVNEIANHKNKEFQFTSAALQMYATELTQRLMK
jgi:hypothetical protein